MERQCWRSLPRLSWTTDEGLLPTYWGESGFAPKRLGYWREPRFAPKQGAHPARHRGLRRCGLHVYVEAVRDSPASPEEGPRFSRAWSADSGRGAAAVDRSRARRDTSAHGGTAGFGAHARRSAPRDERGCRRTDAREHAAGNDAEPHLTLAHQSRTLQSVGRSSEPRARNLSRRRATPLMGVDSPP